MILNHSTQPAYFGPPRTEKVYPLRSAEPPQTYTAHSMPHEYIWKLLELRRRNAIPQVWVSRGHWYIDRLGMGCFDEAEAILPQKLMELISSTEVGVCPSMTA